jgi:uracil-DNA glycosylase
MYFMNKQRALDKIAKEIEQCEICKVGKIGKAVPGEGNPDADIVFIGEAPGKTEAKTGRPFVGRSGKYLRSIIRIIELNEDEVYITSPVKYLPTKGTPTPAEIAHGKKHLDKQLAVIDPKIIVLMGSVAVQGVLGSPTSPRSKLGLRGARKISVMKEHGEIIKQGGKKYFITLHPAAALRFQPLKKIVDEDFIKLKNLIKE